MTTKDKLKSLGTETIALATSAYASMTEAINEYAKICDAENQLASVSGYDFVWAFKNTAKAICECRMTPNTETYISLCEEAVKHLVSGDEQADVLYHFDLILERETTMIKDSGNRRQFETGAVRDIQEGKGRCDLLPLDVVAKVMASPTLAFIYRFQIENNVDRLREALTASGVYHDVFTMFLEVAKHFEEGAKKYGEYNWQKGIPTHCYIDSAVRHYLKWLRGDKDEPHDRAFCWNIMCCIWTCINKPELNDYRKDDE